MKSQSFWKWALGVNLAILPLAAPSLRALEAPPESASTNSAGPTTPAEGAATDQAEETSPEDTLADAPAKPVSTEKPLPPNIQPTGPLADVIKMANAGVEERILLTYVNNSSNLFNLGADEIIYLNDIGVQGPVITAMLQRDEALRNSAATVAATPPPAAPAPAPQPAATALPAPAQVAPQPAYTVAQYPTEPPPPAPAVEVADPEFYDTLSPYGSWVEVEGYGRCWQPTVVVVNPGWQPYFNCGHWVYTDCGWYWLSDYSWGWAPFHYGRWFRHHRLGWCWAPDRVWGPSWVSWRYSDDYCGWAPLPPSVGFTIGIGLTFHGRPYHDHDDFGLRAHHYRFVAWNHFHERELHGHSLGSHEAAVAFNHSTVATRISGNRHSVVNSGLPVTKVAAATHTPVRTVALRETSGPAPRAGRAEQMRSNGRTLEVYRPHFAGPAQRSATTLNRPGTTGPSGPRVVQTPTAETARPGARNTGVPAPRLNTPAAASPLNRSGVPTSVDSSRTPSSLQSPKGVAAAPEANRPQLGTRPTGTTATSTPTPWSAPASKPNDRPGQNTAQPARPYGTVTPTVPARAPDRPSTTPAWQRPASAAPTAAPNLTAPNRVPRTPEPTARPSASPAPAPNYQAPAQVPRYVSPTPSYTAPRQYSAPAPAAPSYTAPRQYSAPSYSAPRQPSAPSYPPAAPARPSFSESRPSPAPASPPPSSGGGSRSNRDH